MHTNTNVYTFHQVVNDGSRIGTYYENRCEREYLVEELAVVMKI